NGQGVSEFTVDEESAAAGVAGTSALRNDVRDLGSRTPAAGLSAARIRNAHTPPESTDAPPSRRVRLALTHYRHGACDVATTAPRPRGAMSRHRACGEHATPSVASAVRRELAIYAPSFCNGRSRAHEAHDRPKKAET